MANSLLVKALDDELILLDSLPSNLYGPVVTHSLGEVKDRAVAVQSLRQSLLKGELPSVALPWPDLDIQKYLINQVENLGIARFCYQNETLVDEILLDVLNNLEEIAFLKDRLFNQKLKEQEAHFLNDLKQAAQKALLKQEERKSSKKASSKQMIVVPTQLTKKQRKRIYQDCQSGVWQDVLNELELARFNILDAKWQDHIVIWEQLESLFNDMSLVAGFQFDLGQGFFKSHGWLDLVKLNAVIEKTPQLREVINTLGRMKVTEGEPIIRTITEKITQQAVIEQPVVTPLAPMETKGVTRSDEISRMLPQESAMLSHPVLKRLWHARRAEKALCTYAVEGTLDMAFKGDIEVDVERDIKGIEKNKNMGPMIICLDTSGSMKGLPENIAKAIVLECLKVATVQKRKCLVYSFSGAGDIAEFELKASSQGLDKIIAFLSMSFSGGTDINGPLNLALDHCKKHDWHKADIMLVSDGEFHANSGLKSRITRRKKAAALSIHGVVVGGNVNEFKTICDPLHHFDQWEHMAAFEEYRK